MKKYTSIGLSILMLAGVIVGMTLWVRAFYTSVQNYRSPLRAIDLSPSSPTADTGRVVIVLIGSLGYDTSLVLDLPVLEQLKQVGVNAAVESIPPTYSQTAWVTLISGASPPINDAPPVDMPREKLRLLRVDTIFARAHEAGLQTALLGVADWRRLIPRNQLDHAFFVDEPGPEADRTIFETALSIIEHDQADLMLIHFTQVDLAGRHQGGPAGPAYQQAANRVDAYLGQISAAINLRDTTLLVLSDHGQISSGGYGGAEPDVIWQPFVMVGSNTNPGNYSDIHQIDIVPTMSTLLGIAPPGAAQGRILFEMLRLDEYDQTVAQLLLAKQRVALAEAYISQIQGETAVLPDTLTEDLTQAQASLTSNNIEGAFELALLTQQEADTQMAIARNGRIRREQLPRLVLTALLVFIWLVVMWRRRGLHAGSVLVAVVATVVLYHALYWLQGYSYSISALFERSGYTALPFEVARRAAVSLLAGGGLLLISFMLTDEIDWTILLGTGYGFSVLATFIFILPFFWGFWQNGLVITWRLPEVDPAYWQISSAFESMSVAVLGLILPWPIMSLSLFINLIRRRLSETRAGTSKPGPLPGLRF